jgi:hypothetical protein
VMLLGLVLVGLSRSGLVEERLDVRWLAGAVIVGTLAWMVSLLAVAVRTVPRDDARAGAPAEPAGSTGNVTSEGEVRG